MKPQLNIPRYVPVDLGLMGDNTLISRIEAFNKQHSGPTRILVHDGKPSVKERYKRLTEYLFRTMLPLPFE